MPASLTAIAASPTEIDLAWENDDPNATAIQVLRSTDGTTFTALPSLDGSSSSYADTGLTPNTPYWYQVITEGPGGSSAVATVQTSTPSVDAPSGLTAAGISTSEIDLQWTNNSTTATGIEVDRSTDGVNFTPIATGLPPDTTRYPDTTGLEDNKQYWYEVKATGGSSGDSSFSPPASAWTIAAAPSGLSASVPSSFEVDLSWTNNSSGSPTFTIERSSDGSPFTPIGTTAAGATSYQDLTVTDDVTYTYEVVATNGAGANSAPSNAVTVSTPQAVLDALTATGVSATEIDLAWTDNSGGTAAAQVWRSLDDSTWTLAATLAAGTTSYPDTGLTPDTIYYYYLSTSGPSSTASTNQTAGVTLPTAPTGLTATPGTDNGDVQLS
jgi:phosphodiesterase/alkaline phosphatase D-like protein